MEKHLLEDWQFCFFVKGLVAPEEGITLGDIMIFGVPPSHDASIFFKVSTKPEKDNDALRNELLSNLRNIVKVYGLVSNTYVDVMSGSSASKISSEHPFGDKKLRGHFGLIPVFDEERRRREIPLIEKTITKYEVVKPIFQGKAKGFLRNAIDYYYRSLKDDKLEEKIIDLMISLESLFSNERDELGLRYSLRTTFLLGVGQEAERPNIFRKVQTLYGKRSKVVHGTEDVDLEYKDISTLQEYVREAIKRLIHIEMSKQKFLTLLDESVYDEEKRVLLNQIVMEAMKKW
jgi:hypothetical protein